MNITAEKMLSSVVYAINEGQVNTDVCVRMADGETMVAVMTKSSVKKLGLCVGKPLFRNTSLSNDNK